MTFFRGCLSDVGMITEKGGGGQELNVGDDCYKVRLTLFSVFPHIVCAPLEQKLKFVRLLDNLST